MIAPSIYVSVKHPFFVKKYKKKEDLLYGVVSSTANSYFPLKVIDKCVFALWDKLGINSFLMRLRVKKCFPEETTKVKGIYVVYIFVCV